MKTKIIILGAITAGLALMAFKLHSNKKEAAAGVYRPDLEKAVLVTADTVKIMPLEKSFSYTGALIPNREVLVIPQVKGQLRQIYFKEGDTVKQGQTLVQIDDDILRAKFAAAESNYIISKRNLERNEMASKSGGVSNMQLDNYRLGLATAESELQQLRKQIEWSRITAPFTGIITMRDAETGAIVDSKPLARITDTSVLKLEIEVPEKEILLFSKGEEVMIQSDVYPDKELKARIDYISNRADESHNYTVKIVIDNASKETLLRSGMYGTVVFKNAGEEASLVIPRTALLGSSRSPQAIVVQNGKAEFRDIRIGGNNADYIEVIQGLEAGETVVTGGHINLSDGSVVRISNQ